MKALLLTAAYLVCVVGMGCLALSIDTHWQQVRTGQALSRSAAVLLRVLGTVALAASLVLCLRADHASMAALVWILTLTAAAVCVACALSWRPRWLAPLVFWLRPPTRRHEGQRTP